MKNYNFLHKINSKHKMAIVIGLLLVFVINIFLFLLLPTISDVKEIKKEIQAQRREVERQYEQRKEFGDISDKLKEIKSQLGLLNKPFVLNAKKLEFITELERLAQENNIDQEIELKMDKAQKRGFYRIVPLNISTSGEFRDQMKYLIGLETLDEYINVHYLILNSPEEDSFEADTGEKEDRDQIEMLIRTHTYWAEEVNNSDK